MAVKFQETYGEYGHTLTVAELREWLEKFDGADLVNLFGGEDGGGEFCGVTVADSEEDLW